MENCLLGKNCEAEVSFHTVTGDFGWIDKADQDMSARHASYLEQRKTKYPYKVENYSYKKNIEQLLAEGTTTIRQKSDSKILKHVKKVFDQLCSPNSRSRQIKLLKKNDYQKSFNQHGTLLVFPELLDIATSDNILNVVNRYFQCKPALVHAKIIKTYPSNNIRKSV